MMTLQTTVGIEHGGFMLGEDSRVMLIGSCFAEHVGEHLTKELNAGMVDVNPFGVLYNPISIGQALRLLISDDGREEIAGHVFLGQDGVWHSWLHTTHFSASSEAECRKLILERYDAAREFVRKVNLLCITFGTTRCYQLCDKEQFVVANCHKEPQRRFTEREASLDELIMAWKRLIADLQEFNPDVKVCLTVSPYRYKKYGFHESQIQKAKLLLLTEALKDETVYFPAYELMMDELRDYRFYADDMLHPSGLAVQIIYDRFKEWCFTDELKALAVRNKKEWKSKQHKTIKR